jgi:hypothetical protein
MTDEPASAQESGAADGRRRRFPHIRPLTDEQYAEQHADAVWSDACSTDYGRAELRPHQPVFDRPAWRFPYSDRVYVIHRYPHPANLATPVDEGGVHEVRWDRWAVSLWLAPFADPALGLPTDPATAPVVHVTPDGPLVVGAGTRKDAVRGLALRLIKTKCDHGYGRGRDSCPGCDVLDDMYDDLP